MSEFNPFGAAEEAPVYVAEESEEAAGSRRNVVLLGALAAVVLGAGAFLFLGGGDDEVEEFGPVARAPRAAAPVVTPTPVVKLPAASKVTLGRNPFRALYIQPAAAPAAPAAGAPAPAGAPVGAFPVGNVGGPATTGGSTAGGATTGTSTGSTSGSTSGTATPPKAPTAKEYKLVLTRVFGTGKDQSAAFSIDGKQQTAKVGSTFGPHAEILLLSLQEGPKNGQWTAVLQVGDGDPFDVVTGVPAYVR